MSQITILLEIVEQLYQIHVKLLRLAEQKLTVLIQGDIKQLDHIIQEEMKCFQALSPLEQKRLSEMKMIAQQERIPEQSLTMFRLQSLTKDLQEKTRMQKLTEEFGKISSLLREKNDKNEKLIKQSLQSVQYSMQSLYLEEQESAINQNEIEINSKQRKSTFDFRV